MTDISHETNLSQDPAPGEAEDSRAARLRALGAEIRALRRGQDLSTAALAARCGLSTSLISQVERGLTAPSLEALWAIARALEVPIGTFFHADGDRPVLQPNADPSRHLNQPVIVVRAGERKRLGLTPSLTYQLLSPDLQHRMELVWVELGPGEEGPVQPFTHAGEEQMVVIKGSIRMWIGGHTWDLDTGDSITFDSAVPHRVINPAHEPAIIIAAITPPSF